MAAVHEQVEVHAFAHITGGGVPDNLDRSLPGHCDGVVHRGTWDEPRIFSEIQAAGDVSDDEMEQVFNLGLGMLAVVPNGESVRAVDAVRAGGLDAWLVGEIVDGHGRVHVDHASR